MTWFENLRLVSEESRALQRPVNTTVGVTVPSTTMSTPEKWRVSNEPVHKCGRCGETFPSLGRWAQHVNPPDGPPECPEPRPPMPEAA